jgi:type I restriction enzyme R subunit
MTNVGQPERATQNRVLSLFRNKLGYCYLGDLVADNTERETY